MKNTLLFDFDGTIADSFENFLDILDVITIKYNLEKISRAELDQLRSESASSVVKKLNIPLYKLPFLARDIKKLQSENLQNIKPFTTLPVALHKLKELGYTLGILTSNGEENVKKFLELNDLNIFDHLSSSVSIFGKDKALKNFIKKQKIKKENIIYIGDEIRDIEACKKIGIPIISVTWGFNSKNGLAKYSPDYLIEKPSELFDILINKGEINKNST